MPFGLPHAPATFQHFVIVVFRVILVQYEVIYLDDMLVFSDNLEQRCYHVHSIPERLQKPGLFTKLEKCIFD